MVPQLAKYIFRMFFCSFNWEWDGLCGWEEPKLTDKPWEKHFQGKELLPSPSFLSLPSPYLINLNLTEYDLFVITAL